MSSVPRIEDDRSTRARIRDAAIETYGRLGIPATTVRQVATAAGVSPGSVIHHFGSMDGLRQACDEYVTVRVRQAETEQIVGGFGIDPVQAWREGDFGRLGAYLARVLVEDSPAVARLVDDMVSDAEGYLSQGVESGVLRPTDDVRGRAVVLTVWSLGAFVLNGHLRRLLGTDLTDPAAGDRLEAYLGPAYEALGAVFVEPPPGTPTTDQQHPRRKPRPAAARRGKDSR